MIAALLQVFATGVVVGGVGVDALLLGKHWSCCCRLQLYSIDSGHVGQLLML